MQKLGRNEPCYCGSGIKYKRCCLNKNATNLAVPAAIVPEAAPADPSIPDLINEQLAWENETYQQTAMNLYEQTQDLYPADEVGQAIRLWNDYSKAEQPVIKKAGVFPAALEQCICAMNGHEVTKSQLADKYDVSVATITQRANQIMSFAAPEQP
ncbi:YecA family protein [Paenibacillus spongiae]|uniref:SEC-C domain-containing protein n=1 Tax=Paenibacillus spongiae TaxID=2909671 RepID=A0ABY5S9R3_9BACL|nr:SEC-C metal-binding domain-containing protein [Paenibacillus spongiae]UVI30681.1 SEC-C domain-containing protein [Paenibacillus spongiae]